MSSSNETDNSRTRTNESLRVERQRSDDELLALSDAIAEDSDELIQRARERARLVLELAREREDEHLLAIGGKAELRETVREERRTEDAALAAERDAADAQRLDERERRRVAMVQLLAFERAATDQMLAAERGFADRSVSAREDLLAIVAHDLRNMLSAVLVNAAIIVIGDKEQPATVPAAHIQRVGAQMAKLLDDLLDFSSFEAGKLTLAMADIDVVQIVDDAVGILDGVAKEHCLALTMLVDAPSVIVRGDGRRLTRLVMNLIANALKYTPANGRVDVSVSVVGDECEIAVADTGVGIPKDQLQSIFERFQQVGSGPRRSSGVGLAGCTSRVSSRMHTAAASGPRASRRSVRRSACGCRSYSLRVGARPDAYCRSWMQSI